MNRFRALAFIGILGIAGSACTFGVVFDERDGSMLGRAQVKFQSVDLSYKLLTNEQLIQGQIDGTFLTNDVFPRIGSAGVSASTWAASDIFSNGGQGAYYLNPYGNVVFGANLNVQVPAGWMRVVVFKSGYDTRVFYRNHLYSDCAVPLFQGPISADRFPYVNPLTGPFINPTVSGNATQCASESFWLLRSDFNYFRDPDIIVDLRSLRDHEVSFKCDDLPTIPIRCLRVSVGTANVGSGPLEIARSSRTGPIEQRRVDRSDNPRNTLATRLPASSSFEFVADGHNHIHLSGWSAMRLRKITSQCGLELTATNCPIAAEKSKTGFCLRDTNQFDSGIAKSPFKGVYMHCVEADAVKMGISVGWYDVYAKDLPGQAISIDRLAAGDYWLEVEVNPANADGIRPIIESDYSNNITRLKVTIPAL